MLTVYAPFLCLPAKRSATRIACKLPTPQLLHGAATCFTRAEAAPHQAKPHSSFLLTLLLVAAAVVSLSHTHPHTPTHATSPHTLSVKTKTQMQVSDIRPELQGRQAEMYWPDDNMWYLIEIHTVNVVNKTAMIVYRTGEVEELNLSEIANEGHMSLIEM